jgi:hypothetical protein
MEMRKTKREAVVLEGTDIGTGITTTIITIIIIELPDYLVVELNRKRVTPLQMKMTISTVMRMKRKLTSSKSKKSFRIFSITVTMMVSLPMETRQMRTSRTSRKMMKSKNLN